MNLMSERFLFHKRTLLPVKIIRIAKYSDFKREFQNIFNIYFSYTYDPYPLRNQPKKFS